MFGLGGDMMKKLQDMQQQVEESKKRLDTISVNETYEGVSVTANGNRKITDITISEDLLKEDKEDLQDILITAVNKAISKADEVNESEMKSSAQGLLGGFPGM